MDKSIVEKFISPLNEAIATTEDNNPNPEIVKFWRIGLGISDELKFIIENGILEFGLGKIGYLYNSDTDELTALDSTVVFKKIERTLEGEIESIEITFIPKREWDRKYFEL